MPESSLREAVTHGNATFPMAYYLVDAIANGLVTYVHWHEEWEIIRVIKGELELTLDGRVLKGKGHGSEGDIFVVASSVVHAAELSKDCRYECVVFNMHFMLRQNALSNTFVNSLIFNQKQIEEHIPYAEQTTALKTYLNMLFYTMKQKPDGYQLCAYGMLFGVFSEFKRMQKVIESKLNNSEALTRIDRMRKALSYIHNNYAQNITLTELSELLSLKPPSIVKLFKDIINRKPIEYINSYRILCAKEMLKNEGRSISDVAHECGYTDVSYFTKVFKKYAHVTPRDYVRNLCSVKIGYDGVLQESANEISRLRMLSEEHQVADSIQDFSAPIETTRQTVRF